MIYSFGCHEIDVARVEVRRETDVIATEPQVFDLIVHLVEHRDRVVRKEELLDEVWGDRFVSESTLTSRIAAARQALGDDGRAQNVIKTAHGRGYRFVADVEVVTPRSGESGAPAESIGGRSALIGRETDLSALATHLTHSRLVTLTGPGGVGKTSLASVLMDGLAPGEYPDGVWFVELVSATPEAVSTTIASVLDVQPRRGQDLHGSLVEVLTARRALLVLDNCEHVIDAVSVVVSKLLGSCPDLKVLATSRESLQVSGEQVYPLPPLGVQEDAQQVEPSAAFRLFCTRAQEADPHFTLDEANSALVEEICSRLDGIPLAIELAAARTRALDVDAIAARLDERFRLLKGTRRGGDPRHRTMFDTIGWSYELLEPEEQRLFCQLSVFSGPFDLPAAEEVCDVDGDVADLIMSLVDRSMVALKRSGTVIRYELLESLRVFGDERLSDRDRIAVFGRHCDHYVDFSRRARIGLDTDQEFRWSTEIAERFSNLRSAHVYAIATGNEQAAMAIVTDVREYAMRAMRYEVAAWAQESVDIADPSHPLYPTTLALTAYGSFVRGDYEEAVQRAERARSIEAASGVSASGLVERTLGNCHSLAGQPALVAVECELQIEIAQSVNSPARVAHAEYMYSAVMTSLGRHEEAQLAAERARSAARVSGNATAAAGAEYAAAFALTGDDAAAALQILESCDELSRSVANRWMSSFARNEMGSLLLKDGQIAAACDIFAELLDVWHRSGDWSQLWLTLNRSIVALDQTDQHRDAAVVIGAVEAHATIGATPSSMAEQERISDAVSRVEATLGATEYGRWVAEGTHGNVGVIVQRTRNALKSGR